MKVEDKKAVGSVPPVDPKPTRAPASAPSVQDKVTVQAATQLAQAVDAALQSGSADRAARLRSLEAAVKLGHYRPNPQQIADRILEQGEIEARLRAMFED